MVKLTPIDRRHMTVFFYACDAIKLTTTYEGHHLISSIKKGSQSFLLYYDSHFLNDLMFQSHLMTDLSLI